MRLFQVLCNFPSIVSYMFLPYVKLKSNLGDYAEEKWSPCDATYWKDRIDATCWMVEDTFWLNMV